VKTYHPRKTIRLREYDYSQPGGYFVTICTKNREMIFGDVVDGEMRLSAIGAIASQCWQDMPIHFTAVELDEFVLMPNHVHGIIIILDNLKSQSSDPGRGVQLNTPTVDRFSRISPRRNSLGVVVRTYKAAVTTLCRNNGYPDFGWQRSYFEHIIRDDRSLSRIREYIASNPQRWMLDKENPNRRGSDEFHRWLTATGSRAQWHTLRP
jgi:putative transposase